MLVVSLPSSVSVIVTTWYGPFWRVAVQLQSVSAGSEAGTLHPSLPAAVVVIELPADFVPSKVTEFSGEKPPSVGEVIASVEGGGVGSGVVVADGEGAGSGMPSAHAAALP